MRRVAAAVIIRAMDDLSLARNCNHLVVTRGGARRLDGLPYPSVWYIEGIGVHENPLVEVTQFFQSETFNIYSDFLSVHVTPEMILDCHLHKPLEVEQGAERPKASVSAYRSGLTMPLQPTLFAMSGTAVNSKGGAWEMM